MERIRRWLCKIWLAPFFMMMGIPGEGEGEPGGGGGGGEGEPGKMFGEGEPGGGEPGGGGGADDLSGLFSVDEIAAKKQAVADAKAEEERLAKLTPEERDAEIKAKAEADKKNVVPEEYAEFTMPEGLEVNKELLDIFIPLAKELKLTQEGAQKIVDIEAKLVQHRQEQWENETQGWLNEAKSDPEIGGEKWTETLNAANAAFDAFATPELRGFLDRFKLGRNKEVIRAFSKIGRAMSEKGMVLPGGAGGESDELGSRARSFYGKSNMK